MLRLIPSGTPSLQRRATASASRSSVIEKKRGMAGTQIGQPWQSILTQRVNRQSGLILNSTERAVCGLEPDVTSTAPDDLTG
jgi:hypothetical protein